MEDVLCPFCRAANGTDSSVCANCQRSLIVGKLTSMGTGVLPKGFVWEMRPKDAVIGRQIANDFVIPSNLIAGRQLRFQYAQSGFVVEDLEGRGRCTINGEAVAQPTKLHNGVQLRIGVEEFHYEFIRPSSDRVTKIPDPMAAHLQLTLAIISEFHSSLDMQEVFDNALDAVLRITRTSRAYAFMVDETDDGEAELREVAARAAGGKPLGAEDTDGGYTISQSVIERVLTGDNTVLVEDAGAQQVNTETIRRFKLKSLVCLPLVTFDSKTGRKRVMGIIYADSLMPTGQLPAHCRPTLQMLTQIVTATIVKWQSYNHMQQTVTNCERSIKALEKDLEVAMDQIQTLQGRVEEAHGFHQINRDELVFELEAVNARIQAVKANLQRLHTLRRR